MPYWLGKTSIRKEKTALQTFAEVGKFFSPEANFFSWITKSFCPEAKSLNQMAKFLRPEAKYDRPEAKSFGQIAKSFKLEGRFLSQIAKSFRPEAKSESHDFIAGKYFSKPKNQGCYLVKTLLFSKTLVT